MRVVFMGTAEFASKTLQALVSAGHDVMYAISQPNKSKNRNKKILEVLGLGYPGGPIISRYAASIVLILNPNSSSSVFSILAV